MDVVCQNTQCAYRNCSGFCVKDFVFLTEFGQCAEWWNKNGSPKTVDKVPVSDKNGKSNEK